jgi:hypothetical protein
MGFGFFAFAHQRAARAMDAAMEAKMIALEQAEAAAQAARALEDAKKKQRND